jgi:hypothetical protein
MVEFSLILACITSGSITLFFSLDFIGMEIGGFIGGIIVGFVSSISQYANILRTQWRKITSVNLTIAAIFLIISAFYLFQDAISGDTSSEVTWRHSISIIRLLFLLVIWYSFFGVVVGVLSKWICKKWLKSEAKFFSLTILFILLLFGFIPYQVMVENYQFALFWLAPSIPAILLLFFLKKKQFYKNVSSEYSLAPLLLGFSIACTHFLVSYFLFDPSTHTCSNSRWSLISTFFMAPSWAISALPFVSRLFEFLINARIDKFYLFVLVSSSYYGYSSSLLMRGRKYSLVIGIILLLAPILLGCFIIFGAIAIGCGA